MFGCCCYCWLWLQTAVSFFGTATQKGIVSSFFFLLQDAWPFAVSASTTALYANDSEVRGRQLPWGRVEVDNPDHSDFVLLRNLLIRTHMQDLIETTNNVHYEHYRRQHLSNVTLEQSLE